MIRNFGIAVSLLVSLVATQIQAAELHGVKFDDKMTVNGKELVLNGLGLRSVNRFGLKIKVYILGLYLPKKSTSVDEVLKDVEGPKVFKMVFHRNVDKDSITDGWMTSYRKNCAAVCEANKSKIDAFNKAMSDMRTGQAIIVTTTKDKSEVDVQGRKPKKITIDGADFARIVEKIWLGQFPPNEELKTGILGGK